MADLLGEVDVNLPSRPPPSKKVKMESRRTKALSPPVDYESRKFSSNRVKQNVAGHMLNTPPSEPNYDHMGPLTDDMDDLPLPQADHIPSSPAAKAADRRTKPAIKTEDDEDDDMMEVAQATGDRNASTNSINKSGAKPISKPMKAPAYPSPESSSPTRPPSSDVDASAWNDVTSKLHVISSQETGNVGKLNIEDALEPDGSLRMFWTDYTDVNGSICLFGKVKDKKSGAFVSAFVKIDNILRKLYFLPRTYRQSKFFSDNLFLC